STQECGPNTTVLLILQNDTRYLSNTSSYCSLSRDSTVSSSTRLGHLRNSRHLHKVLKILLLFSLSFSFPSPSKHKACKSAIFVGLKLLAAFFCFPFFSTAELLSVALPEALIFSSFFAFLIS